MKKIRLNILFLLSFFVLIQNPSFAQNIFDELKKATDQFQKELEKSDTKQKPAPTTNPVPKTPSAKPEPAPKEPVAAPAPKATITSTELANFKSSFPKCEGSDSKTFNKCYAEVTTTNSSYIGEWKNGTRNGKAIDKYNNGAKYEGEFKDDKRHGKGTYTFPDGEKYLGEFKDGKRNGKGMYTFPDGKKLIGEFKDDEFVK
jgi:hypothetical protein